RRAAVGEHPNQAPGGGFLAPLAAPSLQRQTAAAPPRRTGPFLSAPAPRAAATSLGGCDASDPRRCRYLAGGSAAERLGTLHAPQSAQRRATLLHLPPGARAAGPPPDSPPPPWGAASPDAPQTDGGGRPHPIFSGHRCAAGSDPVSPDAALWAAGGGSHDTALVGHRLDSGHHPRQQ